MVTQRNLSDALGSNLIGTSADWRASGVTPARLRTLVRSGDLVRVRHGVYATRQAVKFGQANSATGHAFRVATVGAALGWNAVASHGSAALIHGIDVYPNAPEVVTLTRRPSQRTNRPRSEGIVFHTAELPAEHTTKRYGVALTTVARTVVDIARVSSFMSGVVAADSALRSCATTKEALARVCGTCSHWPGVRQARRVIEFSDLRSESVLESCARVVFQEHGLPAPDLQVTIQGSDFSFSVDFYWSEYRVIAETDGAMKYADPERAIKQLRRDQQLRDAGYKVVHLTWRELFRSPDTVIARVRRAFSSPTPA
jgi:very-short-patch-repair endonuclease